MGHLRRVWEKYGTPESEVAVGAYLLARCARTPLLEVLETFAIDGGGLIADAFVRMCAPIGGVSRSQVEALLRGGGSNNPPSASAAAPTGPAVDAVDVARAEAAAAALLAEEEADAEPIGCADSGGSKKRRRKKKLPQMEPPPAQLPPPAQPAHPTPDAEGGHGSKESGAQSSHGHGALMDIVRMRVGSGTPSVSPRQPALCPTLGRSGDVATWRQRRSARCLNY
jgi:hypothetical protein